MRWQYGGEGERIELFPSEDLELALRAVKAGIQVEDGQPGLRKRRGLESAKGCAEALSP